MMIETLLPAIWVVGSYSIHMILAYVKLEHNVIFGRGQLNQHILCLICVPNQVFRAWTSNQAIQNVMECDYLFRS